VIYQITTNLQKKLPQTHVENGHTHSSHTSSRLFNFYTPIVDRDQTVSRRSKPSSRTFLNVEQTYPWISLHIQDKMSRHRGAKRFRQLGLLRIISLLSLA
jgi:hypothetical protein